MSKNILILGMQAKNSGKTFLAQILIKILKDLYSSSIEVFKPISGSNFFYQSENTVFALKSGSFISSDLRKTHSFLNHTCDKSLEILNPIHTVFFPSKLRELLKNKMRPQLNLLTNDQPGLVRYSFLNNANALFTTLLINNSIKVPSEFNRILTNLNTKNFPSIDELNLHLDKNTENSIKSCFKSLQTNDILITEAYNNYIPPIISKEPFDLVILVGPGIISTIQPEKFKKGIKFLNKAVLPVESLVELTGVENILDLPFIPQLSNATENKYFKNIQDLIREII